ncbi:hypothetical protein LIER_35269 [Lithospermum erythrorhizon]|uniref:Uncharacterized protein n=1 Tax=Lithospermum erythrorhizon TaxID=34254 RepID=A0AAV3NQ78_LITER
MYQEQAHTNATNRGQRKFPHRTGRTAFSEIVHEVCIGAFATQLDVWLVSRSLGKGVKDDGETADLHRKVVSGCCSKRETWKGYMCKKKHHNKSCGPSSSRIRQTIQEKKAFREELHKLKEERKELMQIKEDVKQEREQLSLKLE